MNLDRLYEILRETTFEYRKGAEREDRSVGPVGVTEVYLMPPVDEKPPELEPVDVEFMVIGVDRAKAEARRADLIAVLNTYPQLERLAGGPSYIEVGGVLGSQGAAFNLFALGKVLGLWDLITPKSMGFTGPEARDMAGSGFVMITGYHPDRVAA